MGAFSEYLSHARVTKPILSKLSSPSLVSQSATALTEASRRKALHVAMHRPTYHVALWSPTQQRAPVQLASASDPSMLPSVIYTPSVHDRQRRGLAAASRLAGLTRPPSISRMTPSQPTELVSTEDGPLLRIRSKERLGAYVQSAAHRAIVCRSEPAWLAASSRSAKSDPRCSGTSDGQHPHSTSSSSHSMKRQLPRPASSLVAADSGAARLHHALPRAMPSQPTVLVETEDGNVLKVKSEEDMASYMHAARQHAIVRTRPRARRPGEPLTYERSYFF